MIYDTTQGPERFSATTRAGENYQRMMRRAVAKIPADWWAMLRRGYWTCDRCGHVLAEAVTCNRCGYVLLTFHPPEITPDP